jgi:hypothetical protein
VSSSSADSSFGSLDESGNGFNFSGFSSQYASVGSFSSSGHQSTEPPSMRPQKRFEWLGKAEGDQGAKEREEPSQGERENGDDRTKSEDLKRAEEGGDPMDTDSIENWICFGPTFFCGFLLSSLLSLLLFFAYFWGAFVPFYFYDASSFYSARIFANLLY